MSLSNFTPAVWSGEILIALDTAHRYAAPGVVNRDYEGEISGEGDRVKINSVGDVTISDYVKNTDINSPEELQSAQQELIIDQAKYFNFAVDDVDAVQNNVPVMQEAMRRAAYGLRDAADVFMSGLMSAAAVAGSNKIGTVGTPKTDLGTAGNAYEYLVDLSVELDENDTPEDGRWVIVPPWFHGLLVKDDRFTNYGTDQNRNTLANGMVGAAAGFTVYKSNKAPETSANTGVRVLAGHPMAVSYAEQIVSVEALRPELRFADAVKGLHVYGGKVIRPANLAVLIANRPS